MDVEVVSNLKGIGHFTLWFLVGYVSFLIVKNIKHSNRNILVWGPFIPFCLGTLATTPYAMQLLGLITRETALHAAANLVLLYPLIEQSEKINILFGNFHLNVFTVGLAYAHLLVIYIVNIKRNSSDR